MKYISGARFMDDGLIAIRMDKVKRSLSEILGGLMDDCYPKDLELELTAVGHHVDILECYVHVADESIREYT